MHCTACGYHMRHSKVPAGPLDRDFSEFWEAEDPDGNPAPLCPADPGWAHHAVDD